LGDATAVQVSDVNADGRRDLLFSCESANGKREGIEWLEQGQGSSWKQHRLSGPKGIKYNLMQMIDLDDDGDLDLITCEESEPLGVIWYENSLMVEPIHQKSRP
jgi:hypothetical protein